ncbi:hypothetical protein MPSEU_000317000 [Mayamaea pseudoterrestris]|nr:hypothetical protein MPSEU_000317000 [Mayamaea pseudoterrestris]
MTTSMEIDPPPAATLNDAMKISIHPLAIVNMSDQYTRISLGGSPLTRSDPVVGLLFGRLQECSNQYCLQINDADDIPTDASETAKTQVSLHQAVYPDLHVVGWYRVVNSNAEPTKTDLELTIKLQQHYQALHFVYCVLEAAAANADKKKAAVLNDSAAPKEEHTKKDDDDLPFTLYQLCNGTVLQACEHWHLDTADAERIAVERVMRDQPHQQVAAGITLSVLQPPDRRFQHHVTELSHSLQAIQERIMMLEAFLEQVQTEHVENATTAAPPFSLLRNIQSVLLHMGPLAQSKSQGDDFITTTAAATTTLNCLVEHLAALCHAVDACQLYVDKFRVVQEADAAAVAQQPRTSNKHDSFRSRRGFM